MLTETGDNAACKTCKARKHYPYNDMHSPAAAGISATPGTFRAADTPSSACTPSSGRHPG